MSFDLITHIQNCYKCRTEIPRITDLAPIPVCHVCRKNSVDFIVRCADLAWTYQICASCLKKADKTSNFRRAMDEFKKKIGR